ncbi:hypothetical protein TNCV_3615231 [Trichonephila clavipes]|nr:hypothetical protein TNCV_3615231 [Trichonephila clavipes]
MQENNAIEQHALAFRLDDSSKVLQYGLITLDTDGGSPFQKLDKRYAIVVKEKDIMTLPEMVCMDFFRRC